MFMMIDALVYHFKIVAAVFNLQVVSRARVYTESPAAAVKPTWTSARRQACAATARAITFSSDTRIYINFFFTLIVLYHLHFGLYIFCLKQIST